jgi:hypothetical protein
LGGDPGLNTSPEEETTMSTEGIEVIELEVEEIVLSAAGDDLSEE